MLNNTVDERQFEDLPEEIVRIIFNYLPDLFIFTNIRLVNKFLKRIADDYVIGKILKNFWRRYA